MDLQQCFEEVRTRVSQECAIMDSRTTRLVEALRLPTDAEQWETAFARSMATINTQYQQHTEAALMHWRDFVRGASPNFELDAFQILQAAVSRTTGLARLIDELWNDFTRLYDRYMFDLDLSTVRDIEEGFSIMQQSYNYVKDSAQEITAKMDTWGIYFETMLSPGCIENAIIGISERAQTDPRVFLDIAGPHFAKLRQLKADRTRILSHRYELTATTATHQFSPFNDRPEPGSLLPSERDVEQLRMSKTAMEEIVSQKAAFDKAASSIMTVVRVGVALRSSISGPAGAAIHIENIPSLPKEYDDIMDLAKDTIEICITLRKTLRAVLRRLTPAIHNVRTELT